MATPRRYLEVLQLHRRRCIEAHADFIRVQDNAASTHDEVGAAWSRRLSRFVAADAEALLSLTLTDKES